ncbi:hypothetical protein ACSBR1_032172 [Camellia fascicularis]
MEFEKSDRTNVFRRLLNRWNRTPDGVILAKMDPTAQIGGELGSAKQSIISLTYAALDGSTALFARHVGKHKASRFRDKASTVVDGIGTRRVIVCRSIHVGDEVSEKPRKLVPSTIALSKNNWNTQLQSLKGEVIIQHVIRTGSSISSLQGLKNLAKAVAVEPISHLKLNSKILQESIINLVNGNPRAGWKADMSPRFSNYTVGQFKHLLGVKPTPQHDLKNVPVITHSKTVKLPDQFDARTAWPQCSSIGKILGWVIVVLVGLLVLLSHYLIVFNISLSVNDLLACCGFLCGDGCDGGYPLYAWRYFVHHGVVTEECDPYFDNTGCSHPGCEPAYATPKCKRKCVNKNLLWRQSKHFSVSAYRIHSDPNNIMAEVYKNGPVEVSFTVYEDFAHYKSGVYKHMTGDVLGGHAVKLIGWGTTEDGEDYWLLANQWNRSWGDDGYFKIKRGTNECGIEEDVTGGLPSSKNLIKEFANMDATLDVSV